MSAQIDQSIATDLRISLIRELSITIEIVPNVHGERSMRVGRHLPAINGDADVADALEWLAAELRQARSGT